MKPTAILSILFGIAAASLFNLDKSGAGRSAQDLEEGDENDCPNAILIFARGSTETGNLV
jgi:hypothetical protein